MILIDIALYILAFALIWIGSGFIITSTSRFAKKLRLSAFAISFLLLGILTSTPEFSVGIQAVLDHKPEIFVGNLIGGIIVIFLLIIPLLAIFGNGISLKHELDNKTLLLTMLVIIAPSVFILDKGVGILEGVLLMIFYLILVVVVERKHGLFDPQNSNILDKEAYSFRDIFKILVGVGLVFISSYIIVNKTIFFAELLNVPAFYLSLLVIAVGTDLPEITLVIRSVVNGNKEVAMGDYLGAAAVSTFLFGLFTILSGGEVVGIDSFYSTFIFMAVALMLFYVFSRTKKFISRRNGILMLGIYAAFIVYEVAVRT